ncbi:hypothetical protein [Acetobacter sp.]|jgi:hypothetical protein|uniref:hypothetical protein n=1 Tax=Acetobacter sp. TaxID=440 RepID=UPI0025B7BADB|nr:hypothetical protein [Acetobacter sp.]MCH4091662.1 hypothetical protein [Acetobacter sp.]MCI1300920.1 hypothetical protein [Acetobacter sp.]MCI1316203.1 hypothetical protein [Acetobacter sp.]
MKWLGLLAGALVMSIAVPAHAEDYVRLVRNAKVLTFKDAKPVPVSSSEKLRSVANLEVQDGKYVDDCNHPVTPRSIALDLGKALPDVRAVFVQDSVCYGAGESSLTVLDGNDRVIWQDNATSVAVLTSTHDKVSDLAFQETVPTFSVWRWNAGNRVYEMLETVELPD